MGTGKYVLDEEGNPRLEEDLLTWARWYETAHRQLALDRFGDLTVSTVFLGLDFNPHDGGVPLLWETVVFCKRGREGRVERVERFCTREGALAGHRALLREILRDAQEPGVMCGWCHATSPVESCFVNGEPGDPACPKADE